MNPKVALLIFLVIAASFALVAWLTIRRTGVQAVRRRDLNRAYAALDAIETEADRYDDIDHVLAAQVKDIIRQHRKEQRILA